MPPAKPANSEGPPQAPDQHAVLRQMERLLASPAMRERLGGAARERIAAHFSLDDALDRLSAIYRRFGLEPRSEVVVGEHA